MGCGGVGYSVVRAAGRPAGKFGREQLPLDLRLPRHALAQRGDVAQRGVSLAGMAAFAVWVAAVVCTVAQAAQAQWLAPLLSATGGWLLWLLVSVQGALCAPNSSTHRQAMWGVGVA